MFGEHRFRAAFQMVDGVAAAAAGMDDVIAVMLETEPDTDDDNPGGPVINIYASDGRAVRDAQAQGTLPTAVPTAFDRVAVRVVEAELTPLASPGRHTGPDSPMRPGSSIGRIDNLGTLGAPVATPAGHVITAGHVLGAVGSDVCQPGGGEDARPQRRVGRCVANARLAGGADAGLASIDGAFPIEALPFDSPEPSPATPAAGLLLGTLGDDARGVRLTYLDFASCVSAVNATFAGDRTVRIDAANMDDPVLASGRSTGPIRGMVDGVGTLRTQSRGLVPAFFCRPIGARGGDSGAVCVLNKDRRTTVHTDDAGVMSRDEDGPREWLPGTFAELDDLAGGNGSGVEIDGTPAAQGVGKRLVSRIQAYLRRLGELEVLVTANTYRRPCRPLLQLNPTSHRPANPCREIILRDDGEQERSDEDAFPEDEVSEGDQLCCSFGKKPVVRISGDDGDSKEITLDVARVSLRLKIAVDQRVTSASFRRRGFCHRGMCDPERLTGTVTLKRVFRLEISATAGQISLPGFGTIKAGAAFVRTSRRSLAKTFDIPCARR